MSGDAIDIPGFPGYMVDSDGEVFSKTRTIHSDKRSSFRASGRRLRPAILKNGYKAVVLGRGNTQYVHDLVLLAFVGPRPEGLTASHLNGSRTDNRVCNLRWESWCDNIRRQRDHGTVCSGERNGHARLTADDVVFIRNEYDGRYGSATRLARQFGVSEATVRDAIHRRTWNHV